MAINVADNFSYKGSKPLDARITYATVAAMAGAATADLYDGCFAYVKATQKYYSYDSSNTTDPTTGKWREYSSGGGGEEIQKTTLPTASADELGNIYQYVGTNAALVKGGFYECRRHGSGQSATYQWDLVDTLGITPEIKDFAMSSYTWGSCDSESDLIDALNEFESYRAELNVVSSNAFYGSCWVDTTFDNMPHGTIIKAVYDTDAGWLYKGYDPNSTMEFTIVPTEGTAPDIETITVQALAATPMPAADMSEIVTPLPGVMSRTKIYSPEEQVVAEWREYVDGVLKKKPVYEKTVSGLSLSLSWDDKYNAKTSSQNLLTIIPDADIILNITGIGSNKKCFPMIADGATNSNVNIKSFVGGTINYLILQYTKTTDEWEVV